MWRSLCLTLLAGLLVGCRGESETDGARLDELRQKLENAGLVNIVYMVVNSQDETSRRLHSLMEARLSSNIALYKQNPEDPDVWNIAKAEKDDFQIYDRCGRLTHHLSLPYTILSQPHVEEAIRNTYCTGMCGDCVLE
ncbi:selenoprotein P, partial [Clarias magur]